eukprot:4830967-Prymnesium_polylepis.2
MHGAAALGNLRTAGCICSANRRGPRDEVSTAAALMARRGSHTIESHLWRGQAHVGRRIRPRQSPQRHAQSAQRALRGRDVGKYHRTPPPRHDVEWPWAN